MRVKGDISGLDELIELIDTKANTVLSEIGRESCLKAQNEGNYQNRTGNLRNANGYCVVRDGEVVKKEVISDGVHPDAVRQTENAMAQIPKDTDGLYLVNGMEYASYVEGKGYEVIMSEKLYAQNQIKKRL